MPAVPVILALASAFCIGLGLVLAQIGLRGIAPFAGAALSIPSSALLFVCIAPLALDFSAITAGGIPWTALAIFLLVGLLYPATVTLLTFEANRLLGPVVTGTLGNFTPAFAVAFALIALGEPLHLAQLGGLTVIVAGVMLMTVPRHGQPAYWRSWYLLLPLAAAMIRGFVQPAIKFGLQLWPSALAAALAGYLVSSVIVIAAAKLRTGRFVAQAPPRARLWFVAVGLCNGIALLLMYAALARGPVALVSPLIATYPLATIFLGAVILRRAHVDPLLALGVAFTVAGVALLIAT
jgi:drug/metabolite transporter (DMT)-like permease